MKGKKTLKSIAALIIIVIYTQHIVIGIMGAKERTCADRLWELNVNVLEQVRCSRHRPGDWSGSRSQP